jgi:hypothetical protein
MADTLSISYATPVYLGKDTKMSLNQKSPPSKFSLLGMSRSPVSLQSVLTRSVLQSGS